LVQLIKNVNGGCSVAICGTRLLGGLITLFQGLRHRPRNVVIARVRLTTPNPGDKPFSENDGIGMCRVSEGFEIDITPFLD
jgi:hypothetical protein